MQIAIPIYPAFTALDAIGPYEVLHRFPSMEVVFVGAERGTVRTDTGFLGLAVDATFAEVPRPDLVVVPGGHSSTTTCRPGPPSCWSSTTRSRRSTAAAPPRRATT